MVCIAGLLRTKEGGFISKFVLFSHIYPSANPKVTEGSPIGHKTGLSPLLPRLRRGDKDGLSVMRGIVRGGEGVQRMLWPFTSSALAC